MTRVKNPTAFNDSKRESLQLGSEAEELLDEIAQSRMPLSRHGYRLNVGSRHDPAWCPVVFLGRVKSLLPLMCSLATFYYLRIYMALY